MQSLQNGSNLFKKKNDVRPDVVSFSPDLAQKRNESEEPANPRGENHEDVLQRQALNGIAKRGKHRHSLLAMQNARKSNHQRKSTLAAHQNRDPFFVSDCHHRTRMSTLTHEEPAVDLPRDLHDGRKGVTRLHIATEVVEDQFHALLQMLAEEHDEQLAKLRLTVQELSYKRKENADLRHCLYEIDPDMERNFNASASASSKLIGEGKKARHSRIQDPKKRASHAGCVTMPDVNDEGGQHAGIKSAEQQAYESSEMNNEEQHGKHSLSSSHGPKPSSSNGPKNAKTKTSEPSKEENCRDEECLSPSVHTPISKHDGMEPPTGPPSQKVAADPNAVHEGDNPETSPLSTERARDSQDSAQSAPMAVASAPIVPASERGALHCPPPAAPNPTRCSLSAPVGRSSTSSCATSTTVYNHEIDQVTSYGRRPGCNKPSDSIGEDGAQDHDEDRHFNLLERWEAAAWVNHHKPFQKPKPGQDRPHLAHTNSHHHVHYPKHIESEADLQTIVTSKQETPEYSSLGRFISYPSCWKRMMWDVFGMLLICWDLVMIPIGIFEPEDSFVTDFMDKVTLLFWTLDMPASFQVGYVEEGETIMIPSRIARNYMRTWLIPDCLVVGVDWVSTVAAVNSGDGASVGRIFRILRIMRTIRLLRLLKLKRVVNEIEDRVNSEWISILMKVFKLIVMLLVASHMIACMWYAVGRIGCTACGSGVSYTETWIEAQGFKDRSLGYRYSTALHWSLTQFTPASMSVQPQNANERIFAITVLVVALIVFSSFLSSITAAMNQLRQMSEDLSKEFWLLRRYLRERRVPKTLSTRIIRYLEYALAHQRSMLQESRVQVLTLLSDQLAKELKCAVALPNISVHPLLNHINTISNVTTSRISHAAISRQALACGDNLFFSEETARAMFFVVFGELQYTQESQGEVQWALGQDWISEPCLWTEWTFVGDLQAVTESNLFELDSKMFGEVIHGNLAVWELVRSYAMHFVKNISEATGPMTDLPAETAAEDFEDFLACFALFNGDHADQGENSDYQSAAEVPRTMSAYSAKRKAVAAFPRLQAIMQSIGVLESSSGQLSKRRQEAVVPVPE